MSQFITYSALGSCGRQGFQSLRIFLGFNKSFSTKGSFNLFSYLMPCLSLVDFPLLMISFKTQSLDKKFHPLSLSFFSIFPFLKQQLVLSQVNDYPHSLEIFFSKRIFFFIFRRTFPFQVQSRYLNRLIIHFYTLFI